MSAPAAAPAPSRAGGSVHCGSADHGLWRVTLSNPGKLNAIDIGMWHALRAEFERLQALPHADAPVAVIVCGADGQFAAGGDIAEFIDFRFDEDRLRHFHEATVAPALAAIRDCDLPVYAEIDGACIGGGLEIAACCDIRLCSDAARFGAPIAKIGFPMAPGELQLMCGLAGAAVWREMLLEARLLDAARALHLGLVHAVFPAEALAAAVLDRAQRLAELSPQALRINKQTLRQIARGGPTPTERHAHYQYADSAEHREGVTAFVGKRRPRFRA